MRKATTGTPQGGVISPLLANIYLDALDESLGTRLCTYRVGLARYADDFVILCRRESEARMRRCGRVAGEPWSRLKLELHPEKTTLVELGVGKGGLRPSWAATFRIVRSVFRNREYLFRWPTTRAMNAIRSRIRIRELTNRRRWAGMRDILRCDRRCSIPVLRGWGELLPYRAMLRGSSIQCGSVSCAPSAWAA